MSAIGLTIREAKNNFFDRVVIEDAVDRARVRNLSRLGAFVRTRARSSIRRRKRRSEPGMPPSSHVGYLKDFLFFAFDKQAGSEVVGPVLLNRAASTLDALEYGGKAKITVRQHGKPVTVQAQFQARPFMRPALEAEKQKSAELWKNTVR